MAYQKITLSSLNDGSLEERFQYELKKVLDNIADGNTKGKARRKIAINLEFLPSSEENRGNITCEFSVKASVVPVKSGVCSLAMSGFAGEKRELFQETSRELPLFEQSNPNEINVKEMLNAANR